MSIFDKPGLAGAGMATGQTTLVLGTVAVSILGLTTTSTAQVTPVTPIGTLGAQYKAVCTANTLTITSVAAAGLGTQILDLSVLNYTVAF